MRSVIAIAVAAALCVAALSVEFAQASEARAVSALNGKLEGEYGGIGHAPLAAAGGSLSLPLAEKFGLQFDGLAGRWNGHSLAGGGVHAFWRDPATALVGLYASRLRWAGFGGIDASRAGLETELYLGRVSLEGFAGAEFGDIEDRFSARLRLGWYALDDLRLTIGMEYLGGRTGLLLGGEWQLPVQGVHPSLFVQARVSDRDHAAVWGGLRFYFGGEKSLIRRHREDDPQNGLTDDAGTFGGIGPTTSTNTSSGSGGGLPPPPLPPGGQL